MVRDMEVVGEHVGVERRVVAHSWGAALALHYTAAHPNRAAGLIYISGTVLVLPDMFDEHGGDTLGGDAVGTR